MKKTRVIEVGRFGLFWFSYDHMRLAGFGYYLEEGDEVTSKMQSGREARFRVTKLDRMLDPRDQFFATVEPIGYVGAPVGNPGDDGRPGQDAQQDVI